MMQQLANFIVDHDPMMILRRTYDTVRYICLLYTSQRLRRYRQRITSRICLLEIKLTLRNSCHKIIFQPCCLCLLYTSRCV